MMNPMWHNMWLWIRRLFLWIGALLTFLVVFELLRLFLAFHQFYPPLAWGYAGLLALLVGGGAIYLGRQFSRYPRPLRAPPRPRLESVTSHPELKRYARYLNTYVGRLRRNPHLQPADYEALEVAQGKYKEIRAHHPLNDDWIRFIEQVEQELIPPLHAQLRGQAEKEIRASVRDVMLGVTLSPYHHIDLLIVLYRNFAMIFRIMAIYVTTPAPAAQWRIIRDVMRVVATVNFLYVGRNLIENLFSFIPWVGPMADDIGQGIGAGLFTSACGHAVIERCATVQPWEKSAAVASLSAQSREFLRDVKNIFTRDVLPDIKRRIFTEAPPEKTRDPGFWANVQQGINSAFDATLRNWPRVGGGGA